ETSPRAPLLGATVLAGLTLLVLAKPNVALVALAIGIHLLVVRGLRFFALAAIPASIAGAIAAVIPCLYFHSWGIWGEWDHSVFVLNPYALARPAGGGNYSTPVLVSRWLGTNLWLTAAVIGAILGATLIRAALAPARGSRVATRLRSALEL